MLSRPVNLKRISLALSSSDKSFSSTSPIKDQEPLNGFTFLLNNNKFNFSESKPKITQSIATVIF